MNAIRQILCSSIYRAPLGLQHPHHRVELAFLPTLRADLDGREGAGFGGTRIGDTDGSSRCCSGKRRDVDTLQGSR